jgi:hypothetical protein
MIPDRFRRGGGSSDGFSGSAEDLVEQFDLVDGTDLDVRKLVSLLFGGWVLAWTSNLLVVLDAIVDASQSVLLGVGQGIADLIATWAGLPRYAIWASWRTTTEFIAAFGPFGYPVAVGITIITLWLLSEGLTDG